MQQIQAAQLCSIAFFQPSPYFFLLFQYAVNPHQLPKQFMIIIRAYIVGIAPRDRRNIPALFQQFPPQLRRVGINGAVIHRMGSIPYFHSLKYVQHIIKGWVE